MHVSPPPDKQPGPSTPPAEETDPAPRPSRRVFSPEYKLVEPRVRGRTLPTPALKGVKARRKRRAPPRPRPAGGLAAVLGRAGAATDGSHDCSGHLRLRSFRGRCLLDPRSSVRERNPLRAPPCAFQADLYWRLLLARYRDPEVAQLVGASGGEEPVSVARAWHEVARGQLMC
ncbi:hypothetical protein GCM10023317_85770 [Actinopolymorpha pittospori]